MTPREALKRYFGYDSFRPGQEEIVSALLAGRDALAIMAHRRGQVALLSGPCHAAAGADARHLAADLADAGPGQRAERRRASMRHLSTRR